MVTATELEGMYLKEIAHLIYRDWHNPYFGAEPYMEAMGELNDMDDMYGQDDARTVVMYFLANSQTWRGAVARTVKAELRRRIK